MYRTTKEENEILTRTARGTPMGEFLRRYWWPIGISADLKSKPTFIRVFAEDLVLFRDGKGKAGVIGAYCAHRRANLCLGDVERDGIRCRYHGWLYDSEGKLLQIPGEPADSPLRKETIRLPSYPVEELGGLIFAYFGPQPAPLLPRWDVLVWRNGKRWTTIESVIDCNWLQAMENSVDPSHLYWLHGHAGHLGGHMAQYQEQREFIRFEYGIMKRRVTPGKNPSDPPMVDEHPLVFPTTLRHVSNEVRGVRKEERMFRHNVQIRVPIDDTHTQVYRVNFVPAAAESSPPDQDPPYEYRPLKSPTGEYYMDIVSAQDSMAWETQGPITDRTQENLGASDRGIVMLRRLLQEQIEIVRNGGDPMGVIRDPEKNKIIEFDVINERIGLYRPTTQNNEAPIEAS